MVTYVYIYILLILKQNNKYRHLKGCKKIKYTLLTSIRNKKAWIPKLHRNSSHMINTHIV